jgi:hypothetical protein
MTPPGENEEKPSEVDTSLAPWRQGDCVFGEQWFVHRFDPKNPLTAEAKDVVEQGVDISESPVRGLVVITQSCDIVRSCQKRPYVEVSPLVEVADDQLKLIERKRKPQYAYIPALAKDRLVADLDRVMTVEKAIVAAWTRISGCRSDGESREFNQAVARKRTRFAFPDDFNEFVGRLNDRLQDKHGRASDEGEALRALIEIRVRAAPSWAADPTEIMFWFIRKESDPTFKGTGWDELLKKWLDLVEASGRFSKVDGVVVTYEDITAKDYIESDPLDLDHLSR